MIIVRNRKTHELEQVYSGVIECLESPLYYEYVTYCDIVNKDFEQLTLEEWNRAKANRII